MEASSEKKPTSKVNEPSKETSSPEVMRAALTAEEKARREGFIEALIKASKYKKLYRESIEGILAKNEKYLAAVCERDGILPTLSANYFAWLNERNVWAMMCKSTLPFVPTLCG